MQTFLFITTLVGVVAFAIAGAMISINNRADIFGVVLLAFLNTFGGGMIRDIIIGKTPISVFSMYWESLACLVAALAVFFIAMRFKDWYVREEKLMDKVVNVFDALGIGVFAITGSQAVINQLGFSLGNIYIIIFMGMTTCIGGGMIRDILLGTVPWVLRKRIYALACACGSGLYCGLIALHTPEPIAVILGIITVFSLRMCATVFKWNMPKIILPEKDPEKAAHYYTFERFAAARFKDRSTKRKKGKSVQAPSADPSAEDKKDEMLTR